MSGEPRSPDPDLDLAEQNTNLQVEVARLSRALDDFNTHPVVQRLAQAESDLAAARERIQELEERVKVNKRMFIADGKEIRQPAGPAFDALALAAKARITALTEALRWMLREHRWTLESGIPATCKCEAHQAAAALLREGGRKT